MGYVKQFFVGVVLAVGAYFIYSSYFSEPVKVHVDENGWFGSGTPKKDDETIRPFKISVSDDVINDVRSRLRSSRIAHESLEDSKNFYYGFNPEYLKEIRDYWMNSYNWKKHEDELNKFSHFKTQIGGLNVHYIHEKPAAGYKKTFPLLIVHGWPGNVYEFHKIIPMLTDPKKHGIKSDIAFEVIAPSIPGYGWSEAPKKTGYSQVEAANTFRRLMDRLGHKKYYIQGGDWGALITVDFAKIWPEKLLGIHLNMVTIFPFAHPKAAFIHIFGSIFPSLFFSSPSAQDHNAIEIFKRFTIETGYMHIQATRPDTVGASLNDSPIGLAAYILEKFALWTNLRDARDLRDGGLTRKFTKDELLTIVMIYWINQNIVPSQRFYREFFLDTRHQTLESQYISVPVAHAQGKNELFDNNPIELSRCLLNVTHHREYDYGHFAAFEQPKLLAQDVHEFVTKLQ